MVDFRAPFAATLNITNRCNLRCAYCYASSRDKTVLSTERCIALIDELCDVHGVFFLTIAGGEPLFHPGILTILRESFARHGGKVALVSNGTRLTDDHFFEAFSDVCTELARSGAPLDMQISLDSHIPDVHDMQRGSSYHVLAAVERAIPLPITLQLACVVTRHNVEIAHQIVEAYYPRVRRFHYMNIMPSPGRSRRDVYENLKPSPEQKLAFHERVLELERHLDDVFITKIEPQCEKEGGSLRANGCLAGTTRIDIGPDLTVIACPMSDEILGNLAEQSFEEMWFSERAERIRTVEEPYCAAWCSVKIQSSG